ncbi:cell division protein FtsH, partial [Clostridioides difficile]|nr:cell division protein FtsH [Clostridioides difficile]
MKDPLLGFLLSWLLPGLFIYFIWSFIGKRMAGAQAGMLSLTKSKAKVFMETDVKTTFADVAGIEEAKGELCEIVSYLQDPK